MNPIHQYVNQKTGQRYYYSPTPLLCENCEVNLDFVVLHICWGKNKSYVKKLCFNCSKKQKQETEAEEIIPLMVADRKPKNSKLVLITQPELKQSSKDDSVFSNTLESNYTNNKATRSFHPDYTVLDDSAPVQIGASVDEEKEAEKNKLLESEDELDALLLGFKNEKLLIGDEDEVKKIEGDKE